MVVIKTCHQLSSKYLKTHLKTHLKIESRAWPTAASSALCVCVCVCVCVYTLRICDDLKRTQGQYAHDA